MEKNKAKKRSGKILILKKCKYINESWNQRIDDKYSKIEDIPKGQNILTVPIIRFELRSQF